MMFFWYLFTALAVGALIGYIIGVALEKGAAEKTLRKRDRLIDDLNKELSHARAKIATIELEENRRSERLLSIGPGEDFPGPVW